MSLYPCLHLDLQHSFSFKEGTPQNTCKTTLGFNKAIYTQPRPQGFSLKKWVGRSTLFLREKPWGQG